MFLNGLYLDWTMLILVPGIIIAIWAQAKVKSTFAKYSKVPSFSKMTGSMVASELLRGYGIYDVEIRPIQGSLTDNYNPKTSVLSLSSSVHDSTSLVAISVAAHETGHAIQHDDGYTPLRIRSAMAPIIGFSSKAAWPIIIIGLIFSMELIINLGIVIFMGVVLFQLITLPVEFDASKRALELLDSKGYVTREEYSSCKKVLSAAALTYMAAALASVLQVVRLILLRNSRKR